MGRKPLVQKVAPESSPEYVGGYLDGDVVKLLYRTPGGDLRVRQHCARFASFHKLYEDEIPKQADVLRSLRASKKVRSVRRDGEWTRVDWSDYDTRDKGCAWLEKQDVPAWEADVSPLKRHFADTDDKTSATPRVAFLDIETDSRVSFAHKEKMRVLCWTVVDGASGEPVSGCLLDDSDGSEASLLEAMWAALAPFDVVAAWYGDGFDFPVVQARSKLHGLGVAFQRWRWLDSLEVFRKMNAHVAETGDEKQSMALNSIAQSMLGEGKHDFDARQTWEYWNAGGARRQQLLDYNVQDTVLLWKLERKTQYTTLFGTICAAAGLFVETKNLGAHQQMDGLMLCEGRRRGHHWPTKPKDVHALEPFKGAWVMTPPERAGILHDVHVMDFSGMYPSIMISWNMSPETVRNVADDRPVAVSPLTKVCFYTDVEGILASVLKTLRSMRSNWSKLKASLVPGTPEWHQADRWAVAYKVAANSMYGVMGMAYGRYYNPRIGESVAQNGVWLIQQTISAGKERGVKTIYGDTDSSMSTGVSGQDFREFVEWCNAELYPRLLKGQGCPENCISLAYEKEFARIVFLSAKKYVGRYKHYKGKAATADSRPEVRGLEYKRGDAVLMARRLQGECIEKMMRECIDDPAAYDPIVERYLDHTLNDSLPLEEVVLAKSLSQAIEEYKAKTPPVHVRVAKLLRERGRDVSIGTKVAYVITDYEPKEGGVEAVPAEDWTGALDRYGLWEHLVWPPTQRLLDSAFPKHDWSRFDKVRPRKERPANPSKQEAAGQQTLFGSAARGGVLRLRASEARGFNEKGVVAISGILKLAREGGTRVEVVFEASGGEVRLEVDRKVEVCPDLLGRLRCLLGVGGVEWPGA